MADDLKTFLVTSAITLSILSFNLAIGATTVKASQKMKSFTGVGTHSAVFETQEEILEKVREQMPKKTVNYQEVINKK